MRSRSRWYPFLLIGLALLLTSSVVGCAPNPRYIYENGGIHVGGDGKPIELINNPNATNPTYAELVAFIVADSTDTNAYLEGGPRDYVCSDFAEDVHNNAEATGIRAGWVSIDIEGDEEGHALNAFETTDRGLVYVDCTAGDHAQFIPMLDGYFKIPSLDVILNPALDAGTEPTSWDQVAYVEIGKEYGLIDIIKAESSSYSFYEEYKQKWQEFEKLLSDYNDEVMQYNQEISGNVYIEGTPELARIEAWEARLEEKSQVIDELGKELGDFWFEPLGIVRDIHIHWGRTE